MSLFQFTESVAIKIPSKWKKVGVALGLTLAQIDAIEELRVADPIGCFSEVFTHWQQMSTLQQPVSWTTLVTVLRSQYVGEERLADFLHKTFVGNNKYNLLLVGSW